MEKKYSHCLNLGHITIEKVPIVDSLQKIFSDYSNIQPFLKKDKTQRILS